MSFICIFCNKNYVSKSNLKIHQTTTKRCLEIQSEKKQRDLEEEIKELKNQINKIIVEKNKIIVEKDKIIVENDKIIVALKSELKTEKENNQYVRDFSMKCRQNNTYISNKQRIEYSMKVLHPYEELKENLESIINSKFNRRIFSTFNNVCNFITNDILNYNDKIFYHCHDAKESTFYKKQDNKIMMDAKAEQLLNDIYPLLEKRSKKILSDIVDNTDNGRIISKANDSFRTITNIKKLGSDERIKCIKKIVKSYQVGNSQIKNIEDNNDIVFVE